MSWRSHRANTATSPANVIALASARRAAELLGQSPLLPALPPLSGGLLSLEFGAGVDRLVGPVLQVTDQRPEFVPRRKDITAAGDPGQGLLRPGAEPRGEIGEGGLGIKTAVDQLEQAHPPGVRVAVFFLAEQGAGGGLGVDADEDRATGLEDLVIGTDADAGQVLAIVDLAGGGDGLLHDVVSRPHGEVVIEEVAEQLGDAAERAVTDEDQSEDEWADPGLSDREVKEHPVVPGGWFRGESVIEGLLGLVGLVVDELAADLVLLGELGDGGGAGECVESESLTLGRGQILGGAESRSVEGLGTVGECMMDEHVCFLRRLGVR